MTTTLPIAAELPAVPLRDESVPLSQELRVCAMVAQRELLHFRRSRGRVITGLIQPLMFLFVLGFGLGPLVGSAGGVDFKRFMLPGVIAMTVVSTAIFNGASLVWDREFGFLREMLVSPASRTSIILGKTVGGSLVATAQGSLMLVLAPIIGVNLTPLMIVEVIGLAATTAFTMTTIGVMVASRIQKMQSFQVVMQMLLMPMIFLSGALFPLGNLPVWLTVITRLNPLTYAVDPFRHIILGSQDLPAAARAKFLPGVEVFGHVLSLGAEVGIVASVGALFLAVAVRGFGKTR